ncbi:MAG: ATP-binding protein [Bacteroidales bacterium]|nr:ATP-binding protein [Bacteroidales bacterium]
MIKRILDSELMRLAKAFSVIILTGPRQSGKTTLCRAVFPEYHYINFEDFSIMEKVKSAPKEFLMQYSGGLIIDEVQRMPELFSYIQIVSDEHPDYRYVLTGSNNFTLMERITQSLAGRAAILTLLPLSLVELGGAQEWPTDDLLLRGGYPAVWGNGKDPYDVYGNYYSTYIERDLRQLVNIKDLSIFQQFVRLAAGRVGCEVNAASFSAELGVSAVTIANWFSVLEASYITFKLPPYFRNIGKRIVKSSKLYFHDTGLACYLLGIRTTEQLQVHPLRGQLFENMVVSEFIKRCYNSGERPNLFFYRDSQQKEVDIVEERTFRRLDAYEIKSARHYNTAFESGLVYFRKLFGDEVESTQVLYDGDEELSTQPIGYRNFRRFFADGQIPQ